jgi:hypothetical protein
LLGEFNEQNLCRLAREAFCMATTQEKSRQTQHTAHNHANPPVDELQRPGIEWKSHNITAVVSRPPWGYQQAGETFKFIHGLGQPCFVNFFAANISSGVTLKSRLIRTP